MEFGDLLFRRSVCGQNTTDDIPDNMQGVVSVPTANPPSGSFSSPVTVTLSTDTAGAEHLLYVGRQYADSIEPAVHRTNYDFPVGNRERDRLQTGMRRVIWLLSRIRSRVRALPQVQGARILGKITNSDGSVTITDTEKGIATTD